MIHFIEKFKIPTILGLTLILLGIGAGVFLVLKDQTFISQAAPDAIPTTVNFTNVDDSTIVVSWNTSTAVASFVNYGTNNTQATILDDKDGQNPTAHTSHYFTIKNLLPNTKYQFKVVSSNKSSAIFTQDTASPISNQNGFTPIIGSVLDEQSSSVNNPLSEGIAYLSISGTITQSSQIKSGNFLIPISQIRKLDGSDIYPLKKDSVAKITIVSNKGEASILFKIKDALKPLPSIKLGETLDLTTTESVFSTPGPSKTPEDLGKYDLNSDTKVNATDNTILLQNFGKNPKNKKADLDGNGVVDQKDVDIMSLQIESDAN